MVHCVCAMCMYACLKCTFFCFSLLPLKHLLLWRQSLLQELHVKLILLLHLLLLSETHLIAYIALEPEAQCDHRVADATRMEIKRTLISIHIWGKNTKQNIKHRNTTAKMPSSQSSFLLFDTFLSNSISLLQFTALNLIQVFAFLYQVDIFKGSHNLSVRE